MDPGSTPWRDAESARTFIGRPVTTQGVTYPDYRDFDTAEHFAATAAYSGIFPQTIGRGETAVRVASRSVSASFFGLLGVAPALGRFFTPDEDRIVPTPKIAATARAAKTAVITHFFMTHAS